MADIIISSKLTTNNPGNIIAASDNISYETELVGEGLLQYEKIKYSVKLILDNLKNSLVNATDKITTIENQINTLYNSIVEYDDSELQNRIATLENYINTLGVSTYNELANRVLVLEHNQHNAYNDTELKSRLERLENIVQSLQPVKVTKVTTFNGSYYNLPTPVHFLRGINSDGSYPFQLEFDNDDYSLQEEDLCSDSENITFEFEGNRFAISVAPNTPVDTSYTIRFKTLDIVELYVHKNPSDNNVEDWNIELAQYYYTYEGTPCKPTVKRINNGSIPPHYYTVSYKDNDKIGQASVIISAKLSCVGEQEIPFEIGTDIRAILYNANNINTTSLPITLNIKLGETLPSYSFNYSSTSYVKNIEDLTSSNPSVIINSNGTAKVTVFANAGELSTIKFKDLDVFIINVVENPDLIAVVGIDRDRLTADRQSTTYTLNPGLENRYNLVFTDPEYEASLEDFTISEELNPSIELNGLLVTIPETALSGTIYEIKFKEQQFLTITVA